MNEHAALNEANVRGLTTEFHVEMPNELVFFGIRAFFREVPDNPYDVSHDSSLSISTSGRVS